MRLEDVGFRYHRRSRWVLRDLSLALPPGAIVEVTGANGAGKSTLLRLAAGLLRPRRGRVLDRPARVGYAPERFPADQPFTARAYLTHMARLRRLDAHAWEPLTAQLGFTALLDTPLPELSKGSAHKVGLIQALMSDPELLILDEPFAGLDAATREALPALLGTHAKAGAAVLISDHQQALAHLPTVTRHHLALRGPTPPTEPPPQGGTMEADPSASTSKPNDPPPGWALIEVTVPAADLPTALADLQAKGYQARPTNPTPPTDPNRP